MSDDDIVIELPPIKQFEVNATIRKFTVVIPDTSDLPDLG